MGSSAGMIAIVPIIFIILLLALFLYGVFLVVKFAIKHSGVNEELKKVRQELRNVKDEIIEKMEGPKK
ncbi:hypothetical protein [Paenibacillus sp. 32O-W]|uniref:hypothetical protein n=1 Tax=Paenibacillus sp. 32O-W TaxID=1695218 RepID=UPI0011AA3A4C|nr:hypothetical protein [Paenibacillus sp. 32O-W]